MDNRHERQFITGKVFPHAATVQSRAQSSQSCCRQVGIGAGSQQPIQSFDLLLVICQQKFNCKRYSNTQSPPLQLTLFLNQLCAVATGRGSGGVEAEKWISLAPKTLMKPSLETVAAAAKRASTPDDERDAGNRMEHDHDNDEASIGAVGGPCSPSGSRSKCYQMSRIGYTGLGNLGNTFYPNYQSAPLGF